MLFPVRFKLQGYYWRRKLVCFSRFDSVGRCIRCCTYYCWQCSAVHCSSNVADLDTTALVTSGSSIRCCFMHSCPTFQYWGSEGLSHTIRHRRISYQICLCRRMYAPAPLSSRQTLRPSFRPSTVYVDSACHQYA